MSNVVLDASAVIALLNHEAGAERVESLVAGASISAVNYSEVVAWYADAGAEVEFIRELLDGLELNIMPFDVAQAIAVGALRPVTKPLGLSLGDRACLNLGQMLGTQVVTAERIWGRLGLSVMVIVIR